MQDDITWGVKYLVDAGIADPKRVGIFGGSYGGYATLAGVTVTPDLYAAAVELFGPSNLITLMDSIPPYWESGRQFFYHRMGDPTTPEGKALLIERSPLTSAAKIKTPLMIAQGANDARVNHAESEQIVVALRDRGFPVEYLLIPDEGHGFARPVNNMATIMATEKFFAGYLGGRYQDGGTPEVVARLKEITVDPKTVVLAKKVDASSVGVPKLAMDLQPGTYKYHVLFLCQARTAFQRVFHGALTERSVRQRRLVSSEMMPSTPYSAMRFMSAGSLTVQTKTFLPAPFIFRTSSESTSSCCEITYWTGSSFQRRSWVLDSQIRPSGIVPSRACTDFSAPGWNDETTKPRRGLCRRNRSSRILSSPLTFSSMSRNESR